MVSSWQILLVLAVVLYTFDAFRAQGLCSAGLMLGLLDPCDSLGTKVLRLWPVEAHAP